MKLRKFRNARIRERLRAAAARWRDAAPGRSFETSGDLSLTKIATRLALIALFGCLLLVLRSLRDDGPLLLAMILPVVAILKFLRFLHIWSSRAASESTYLLPFSNRLLTRQRRAEAVPVVLGGAIPAALAGAFGHPAESPWLGGLYGILVYLGFLGFLTLSYYWRFFTFFTLLAYGAFFLALGSMIFPPIKAIGISLLEASPWYLALQSIPALIGFCGAGIMIAFATRRRWYQVSVFDRTSYYEDRDPEQLADEDFDFSKAEVVDGLTLAGPSQPTGMIEKLSWRFFTLPEKGLLRAIGWTGEDLLISWLKSTAIFLVFCGLTHLSWPDPIEKFRTIAPFLVLGFVTLTQGICHSSVSACLGGQAIGPGSTAARFQLFPVTLGRAEKLMLKDSIPRWLLFPLSFASAPLFHSSLSPSFGNILTLFGVAAFCQIHGTFFYFANHSINEWPPSDSRSTGWSILVKLWMVLGILASLFAGGVVLLRIFETMSDPSISLPTGGLIFVLLTFPGFHLILRALIRAWISQPRADLVRQN